MPSVFFLLRGMLLVVFLKDGLAEKDASDCEEPPNAKATGFFLRGIMLVVDELLVGTLVVTESAAVAFHCEATTGVKPLITLVTVLSELVASEFVGVGSVNTTVAPEA